MTYLNLGGWKLGVLINFNVAQLRDGLRRLVLGLAEEGDFTAKPRRAQREETPFAAEAVGLPAKGNEPAQLWTYEAQD